MLENKFLELLEDNYYMIALFDKNNKIVMRNRKFSKYFKNVEDYKEFSENIMEVSEPKSDNRIYVKSPDFDGVIKFEINKNEDISMLTGTRLNYDHLINMIKQVECTSRYVEEPKYINFNKNKSKTYCTFIVDEDWTIKYFSDNVYSLLKIRNPYLKNIRDVFGDDFLERITEKSDFLDIFDDLCIEFNDKLLVVTKSLYRYIILNIYQYSDSANTMFEEVSALKYKIDQLESELKRRKQLIDFQKEIIKSLNRKVDNCKCI